MELSHKGTFLLIGLTYNLPLYPNFRNYLFMLKDQFNFICVGEKASFLENQGMKVIAIDSPRINKLNYYFILGFNLIHPWLREQLEYLLFYNALKKVRKLKFDHAIAFDLTSALILNRLNFKFIFDSHAYLPREFDSKWIWKITDSRFVKYAFAKICKNIIYLVSEDDFANQLYANDKIFSGKKFVFPLYCHFKKLKIKKTEGEKIKIIHHGAAAADRKLERLIDIILDCDERFELYFMLLPENNYYNFLKKYKHSNRIKFIPPVPMDQIPEKLNCFDLSLVVFGSKEFHHKYTSVPNKFWESIQGRIPIIVSPESAMGPITKKLGIGFVSKSDLNSDYVKLINSISVEKINELKLNLEHIAFEHSLEGFKPKFLKFIDDLIS